MRAFRILLLLATISSFCMAETEQEREVVTAVQRLLKYVNALEAKHHEAIISWQHPSEEDRKHVNQISTLMARVRRCGKDAAPILQSHLGRSQSKWEKFWLLGALAHAKDDDSLSVLRAFARDDDEDLRKRAISGLSLLGLPALKSLQQLVEDQKTRNRFKAMQALYDVVKASQTASPESVEDALLWSVGRLKDKDPDVRFIALHIIALGDHSFTHHLAEFLKDENKMIRSTVVEFLAKRDDPAAVVPLMDYLLSTDLREWRVRHRTALAVGKLAKLQLPPLEKRYKTDLHHPPLPYWVGQDRQIDYVLMWWNKDGKNRFEQTKDKSKDSEQENPRANLQSENNARHERVFREAHRNIERWHVIRTAHLNAGIETVVKEAPDIVPYLLKLAKGDRTRKGWPYWALLCGSLQQVGGDEGQKLLHELAVDPNAESYVRECAKRALEGKLMAPDDR